MKKCYYCGAKVSDEARFCPQCGKPMEITRELVQRAITGDADAQSELYSRTFQTVYGRIRVKVPDEDTALDLTQDTYLRAFTHLEQLKEPAAFPGWILTIARNLTINWYKKHARDKNVSLFSQSDYENEANLSVQDDEGQEPEYHIESLPEESLDRAETSRLVQEILDSLPDEQRLVLLLRYVEQMSINEIAETLGENPNTIKTRLTLGKKKVEAKVRELERQGTKLYSLSPLPFLLWLLRNMEGDTPTVSSAEMLSRIQTALQTGYTHGNPNAPSSSGSSASGVQGSSSGSGVLKQSAGAVAQTAGKGVAIKIAAVAVAVVLVGGGLGVGIGTAIHNATTKEENQTTEAMLEEESTGVSETDATVIAPPSAEVIEEMLSLFDQFAAEGIIADFAPGELTASQAIEIAAFAMYETEDTSNYTRISESSRSWAELPTDIHASYLKNLFGSDYDLSDFVDSTYLRQDDSGQLYITDGDFSGWNVSFSVESISETEDESIYTVQACYTMTGYDESNSLDVIYKYIEYQVIADEASDYGWAIISMTESDGSDTTLTTEELYAAYAEIVTEYENSYGEGSYEIDSVNGYQVTGTFLVQLLDFDGDGQEELLIGVEDPSDRNYTMIRPWVDIWACVDGEVKKVYSPELLGLENSNEKNICYNWDIGLDIIYSELDEKICIIQGFLEDGYNYYEYSDGSFQLYKSIFLIYSEEDQCDYFIVDGVQVSAETDVYEGEHTSYHLNGLQENGEVILQVTEQTKITLGMDTVTANTTSVSLPEGLPEFTFSSGAGAWGTTLTLNSDGTFSGVYLDTNYDTASICNFSGKFDNIQQVTSTSYSMVLSELVYENEEGETWYDNGILYTAGGAYGLEGGNEFILYTPGTSTLDLTLDCISWAPVSSNIFLSVDWETREILNDIEIDVYILYNVEGSAFYTDE